MLGLRYHPARVNGRTDPRDVIANGQFLMFPRAAYDAMGTHELVRGEVAEDLAFAQHVVRQGRRLRFVFAETLMETRMYQSLGQLVEGWSKNLYLGSRLSYPGQPLTAGRGTPDDHGGAPVLAAAADRPARGRHGCRAGAARLGEPRDELEPLLLGTDQFRDGRAMWYGLLYPLGAGATLCILLRSMVRGARKVEWRGRVYDEVTSSVREPGAEPGASGASGEALRT
jgi:hypothetical protein